MLGRCSGQVVLMDLIFAFVIFVVLYGITIYMWNGLTETLRIAVIRYHMQQRAMQAADLLVKSDGRIARWQADHSSMYVPGLAITDRVLSAEKVGNHTRLGYEGLKTSLRLREFEMLLRIQRLDGNILTEMGLIPAGQITVNARRIAWFEGGAVIVEVTIWL